MECHHWLSPSSLHWVNTIKIGALWTILLLHTHTHTHNGAHAPAICDSLMRISDWKAEAWEPLLLWMFSCSNQVSWGKWHQCSSKTDLLWNNGCATQEFRAGHFLSLSRLEMHRSSLSSMRKMSSKWLRVSVCTPDQWLICAKSE